MGSCIDDDMRRNPPDGLGQPAEVTDVATKIGAVAVQRYHITQRRQAAAQLPAQLSLRAQQEYLLHRHVQTWPYCWDVHSR